MKHISKLFIVVLSLLVPSLASAGECQVMVSESGRPVAGAQLTAVGDGVVARPATTDEEGMATIEWEGEGEFVLIALRGKEVGKCMDRLVLDLDTLDHGNPATGAPAAEEKPAEQVANDDGAHDTPATKPNAGDDKKAAKVRGSATTEEDAPKKRAAQKESKKAGK
jgi:hypothetical protein